MSAAVTLLLPQDLRAPSHARDWSNPHLAGVPAEVRADVLLIVSELVTNAVRHGRSDIVLGLSVSDVHLRVEVRDASPTLPAVPASAPSGDRPAGRGLLIVAATATDWGVEQHDGSDGSDGKTVWAEVGWSSGA